MHDDIHRCVNTAIAITAAGANVVAVADVNAVMLALVRVVGCV